MATSRLVRYLTSTRNLVASAAGLLGFALHVFGLVGGAWPFAVVALYVAGALVTPPERVNLVLEHAGKEIDVLRRDLDKLLTTVHQHEDRVPQPARARLDEITRLLSDLLDRPDALSTMPDQLHAVDQATRVTLPESFEAFFNLPPWYATGRRVSHHRTAAEELTIQLDLLRQDLVRTADAVYEQYAQRLRNQTTYLAERTRRGDLDLSTGDDHDGEA